MSKIQKNTVLTPLPSLSSLEPMHLQLSSQQLWQHWQHPQKKIPSSEQHSSSITQKENPNVKIKRNEQALIINTESLNLL